MTKTIPLTRGKSAVVDDETFEYLNQYKWYYHQRVKTNKPGYAARRETTSKGKSRIVFMQYYILPKKDDLSIDHINGDSLDNRRSNLRYCTKEQNSFNVSRRRNGQSKYKGVTFFHNHIDKWRANIYLNGRQTFLGTFDNEEDAARAYNRAAKKAHGNFARLNDVDPKF